MSVARPVVGVLALQGAVQEHCDLLSTVGADPVPVRTRDQLAGVDALVLPGGESTAIARLSAPHGMLSAVAERVGDGMPVLGTCAGLVLLARCLTDDNGLQGWPRIGSLEVTVARNAYGAQLASGEHQVTWSDGEVSRAVFIRAPRITALGPGVDVVARVADEPVAVRQGSVVACAFHPELSGDHHLHRMLVGLVESAAGDVGGPGTGRGVSHG